MSYELRAAAVFPRMAKNLVEGVGDEPRVAVVRVHAVEAVVLLVGGGGGAAEHAGDGAGGADSPSTRASVASVVASLVLVNRHELLNTHNHISAPEGAARVTPSQNSTTSPCRCM